MQYSVFLVFNVFTALLNVDSEPVAHGCYPF